MSTEMQVLPVNPADIYAAGHAVTYVSKAVEELEDIERLLPGLIRMEWRSPAASRFEELFGTQIRSISTTLADLRDCAEAVDRHAEELRSLGHEVP